jgi:TolB-like protein
MKKYIYGYLLLYLIITFLGCATPKEIRIESYQIKNTIKPANIEKGTALSVLKFNNLKNEQKYSWLQNLLADVLITNIAATDEYRVVLRDRLESILKEQQLHLTGIVSNESAVNVGNMVGAQTIIVGNYTVNEPVININVKLVNVENSTIDSSINVTGDLNNFLELEKELSTKMFNVLSIKHELKKSSFYSKVQSNSIKAMEYNYKGEEYITRGEMEKAIFELWKAVTIDPEYKIAAKNYSTVSHTTLKKTKGIPFINVSDELKRRVILMEVADFIYEEIKTNGVQEKLVGEVEVRFGNNVAPVPVKVPIKFWVSDHIESFLKRNAEELGGNFIENPNEFIQKGFKLQLTDDKEVNKYFNRLLADLKFYCVVLFNNYKGTSLNKEKKFEIPGFFKVVDSGESVFVICEPTTVTKGYTFSAKRASLIEEIQIKITY